MVQGYVYILGSELGIYKIGRTKNVELRMKQLEGIPFKTELIHTIPCEDDTKFEAELHERYKSKRKTGEWFELSKKDIEELKNIKYVEAKRNDLITMRLSKEQHENLLEMLKQYAEQKEVGQSEEAFKIKISSRQEEIYQASIKLNKDVWEEFNNFCKDTDFRQYKKQDLLSQAIMEFVERYS